MRPVRAASEAHTLAALKHHALARNLGHPGSLQAILARLQFVQADPIRAPARAQDLILRQRVPDYAAGDLERTYAALDIEEDFFVNYGFVTRELQSMLHPRTPRQAWTATDKKRAAAVLAFVSERGIAHPREVDGHFGHGRVQNWFGGRTNASTQLLDAMHYRGWLRVAGREGGVRVYAAYDKTTLALHQLPDQVDPDRVLQALIDALVGIYAPLPEPTLKQLLAFLLRGGVPQWQARRASAWAAAQQRLPHTELSGVRWYWPAAEDPFDGSWQQLAATQADQVRLLAPFDPVVWDRVRFEQFWGWPYRFEAYTPPAKRQRGYYALPMLWRTEVIGWANLAVEGGVLRADVGHVSGKAPRGRAFSRALEEELARMSAFLGLA
jgi:uncharacterized protein